MSWWAEAGTDEASRIVRDASDALPWGWKELPGVPVRGGEGADPGEPVAHVDPEILASEREAGREEGFVQGVEAGHAEAKAEFQEALAAMEATLEVLQEQTAARGAAAEERVRVLSLAVARVLLDREVRTDPSEVVLLVRRSLALLPPEVPVQVRLNPEDLSMLARPEQGQSQPPAMGRAGSLQWVADGELSRGDVVVESPERIVDGRVIPCLERIWEEIADA